MQPFEKDYKVDLTLKEFYTRFALGEQYLQLQINPASEFLPITYQIIEDYGKNYYWQEREVYNKILPYIELLRVKKIDERYIYDRYGFVDRMIPLQRAYNQIKNNAMMIMNRCTYPMATVEDGSVDIDNLEEEGLVPGKILVYRQGAQKPQLERVHIDEIGVLSQMIEYENHLLKEMQDTYETFLKEIELCNK